MRYELCEFENLDGNLLLSLYTLNKLMRNNTDNYQNANRILNNL